MAISSSLENPSARAAHAVIARTTATSSTAAEDQQPDQVERAQLAPDARRRPRPRTRRRRSARSVPRSSRPRVLLAPRHEARRPTAGRPGRPTNGTSSWRTMVQNAPGLIAPSEWSRTAWPAPGSGRPRSGSTPRPRRPRPARCRAATPTKAMELWMVEGRQPRRISPAASLGRRDPARAGRHRRPSADGNSRKVAARIGQVQPPVREASHHRASREPRAVQEEHQGDGRPWSASPAPTAASPRAGSTEASTATARMRMRYQSGLKRPSRPLAHASTRNE